MSELERKLRAAQRRRTTILNRTSLYSVAYDPAPSSGLSAVSLVQQLTRECWALAGKEAPQYTRHETPMVFVPSRLK